MSTIEEQDIALLKQRIYKLEAQVELLYKHLNLTFVEDFHEADDLQIVAALRANNMIEAIKIYRERTGVGLAAAKSAVEAMRARLGL